MVLCRVELCVVICCGALFDVFFVCFVVSCSLLGFLVVCCLDSLLVCLASLFLSCNCPCLLVCCFALFQKIVFALSFLVSPVCCLCLLVCLFVYCLLFVVASSRRSFLPSLRSFLASSMYLFIYSSVSFVSCLICLSVCRPTLPRPGHRPSPQWRVGRTILLSVLFFVGLFALLSSFVVFSDSWSSFR